MIPVKTEEVVTAFNNGANIRALIEMFGIADGTIRYHLAKKIPNYKDILEARRREERAKETKSQVLAGGNQNDMSWSKNHAFIKGSKERQAMTEDFYQGLTLTQLGKKYGKLAVTVRDMLKADLGKDYFRLRGSKKGTINNTDDLMEDLAPNNAGAETGAGDVNTEHKDNKDDKDNKNANDVEGNDLGVQKNNYADNHSEPFFSVGSLPVANAVPIKEAEVVDPAQIFVYRVQLHDGKTFMVEATTEYAALGKVLGEIKVVKVASKAELQNIIS